MKTVNKYNIEEWIFDALEGTLDEQELRHFHEFLESNPSYKEDYSDWKQTYLEESEMEYPGMTKLLKKEKSIGFAYWKWFCMGFIALCVAYFSIKSHGSFNVKENIKVNYALEKLDNPNTSNINQPKRKFLQPDVITDKPIKAEKKDKSNNNLIAQHVDPLKEQDLIINSADNDLKKTEAIAPLPAEPNKELESDLEYPIIGRELNPPKDNSMEELALEIPKNSTPLLQDQSIDGFDMSFNEQEPIADSAILPDGTPGPDSGITMVMDNTIEKEGAIENKENVFSCPLQLRIGLNGGTGTHVMHKEGTGIDYFNTLEASRSTPWDLSLELFYNNLSLNTGIGYIQRLDKYEVMHSNLSIIDSSYWDYTMMLDSNLQIWVPIDSTWVELIDTVTTHNMGRYNTRSAFITVPIMIGYRLHYRNFEFILKTGMVFNFLTGSKGTYHVNADDQIRITNVQSSPFIKVYPQVNLSADILYQFNRNWFLSYTPSYLIGTKNIFHPDRSQNQMRTNLIKHTIGIRYSL